MRNRLSALIVLAVVMIGSSPNYPHVDHAQQASTAVPTVSAAAYLGLLTNPTARGVEVVQVIAGSPAAAAGVRVGDVVISINGANVTPQQSPATILRSLSPGASITLIITRDTGWQALQVTLGTRPTLTITPTVMATTMPITPIASPIPVDTSNIPVGRAVLGFGLIQTSAGIQIAEVVPGSAADQVGLHVDDLLISIDGQPILSVGQVQALLSGKTSGQPTIVTIKRGDQALTFTVTLSTIATPTLAAALTSVPQATDSAAGQARLGVSYDVVTAALAASRQLSVTNGALINAVQPDSPADVAGLKVGDVVTEVDGDKVDVRHTLAIRMIAYGNGDTLTLTVVRGTQTLKLSVTLTIRGTA